MPLTPRSLMVKALTQARRPSGVLRLGPGRGGGTGVSGSVRVREPQVPGSGFKAAPSVCSVARTSLYRAAGSSLSCFTGEDSGPGRGPAQGRKATVRLGLGLSVLHDPSGAPRADGDQSWCGWPLFPASFPAGC